MTRKRTFVIILSLACFLASCAVRDRRLDEVIGQSEFIFRGTVVQTHTSTIDVADASDLAVVRVDDILSAKPPFRTLTSQLVTVRLAAADQTQRGDQRTFFTRSWYFGDSVGVVELDSGAVRLPKSSEKLEAEIVQVQNNQAESALKARVSQAELVLSGRVLAVRKADIRAGVSEHDPDWHEADIQVTKVLKGTATGDTVTVLFPASRDVIWYRAPKYEPGLEGLWLLRPAEFAGQKLKYPTALDRMDFYPKADQARVERLLAR